MRREQLSGGALMPLRNKFTPLELSSDSDRGLVKASEFLNAIFPIISRAFFFFYKELEILVKKQTFFFFYTFFFILK